MDRTLRLKNGSAEISFSDFDSDNEIELTIDFDNKEECSYYLTKENLISVRKHIDYLLSKE